MRKIKRTRKIKQYLPIIKLSSCQPTWLLKVVANLYGLNTLWTYYAVIPLANQSCDNSDNNSLGKTFSTLFLRSRTTTFFLAESSVS